MAASNRPGWCAQCGREPVDPGHVVCSNCAVRTLRQTCTHPWRPELVVRRAVNGYDRPELRCPRCYATLRHPKLSEVDVAQADARVVTEPSGGACAHCGRTDALEVHHWAPWHLFDDPDDWPTARLCPDCHRLWHRVTGTAGTAQPGR